jgi:hypothetical protein
VRAAWLFLGRSLRAVATRPQREAALAPDEADDDQENDRANGGVDDRSNEAGERHETQLPEQPDADEGADDTMTMFQISPKPNPRTICPASQPAIAPRRA